MKVAIEKKMSGTGSIHDIESDTRERVISGPGKYAVVLAAYYGGRGYTTHKTEEAAIKQAKKVKDFIYKIIDENGDEYAVEYDRLVRV